MSKLLLKGDEYTELHRLLGIIDCAAPVDKKYRVLDLFTFIETMCYKYKKEGEKSNGI